MLLTYGCSDDKLDLYPLTTVTEGTFYKNEGELRQAVDIVYRSLGDLYNARGFPDLYGELYSDNAGIEFVGGGNDFPEQIDEFRISTDNGFITNTWNNSYGSIYRCNNILYQLENTEIDLDESELTIMRGQVLLIRSLIYFNLIRVFGGVPYVDKKITYEEAYDYLRTEPASIYNNIISDLIFCKQKLPGSYSGEDVGRVTKYGAAAILAKIYLTLNDKEKAKTELEFIINSNLYSLDANDDGTINTDDFLHLFAPETKNCKASVLEVQYMAGENAMNSNHQQAYTPFFWDFHLPGQTATFRGWGANAPSQDLKEEFEPDDPRLETSIYPGYTKPDGTLAEFPYTMKFYHPDWQNPGQNVEIIRYADILLMYSEVTNEPQYLNMVRARVGMPAFGSEGYPSEKYPTLDLAIEHERRIELCFEFHRFFDLVRTNRALEIMGEKGYNINENKLLFPIPLEVIDVNPNITQNPGY